MDAFISYRRKDKFVANFIHKLLREQDIRAFLDVHDMENSDFFEVIKNHISEAPNFILILSEHIFERKNDNEVDYVREEIKYALSNNKNLILIMTDNYNPDANDWDLEDENIAKIRTWDALKLSTENQNLISASIKSIIDRMVDENGKKFSTKKEVQNADWYNEYGMSDEDRLWIKGNCIVCKNMDKNLFKQIIDSNLYKNRKTINIFCLDLYDVDIYKKRYEMFETLSNNENKISVYGFCHDFDLELANSTFGENHFTIIKDEKDFKIEIEKLCKQNNIQGFDFIDCTLVLKDLRKPEKTLEMLKGFIKPNDGVIYIRDLDDDLFCYYPDDNNYIKNIISFFKIDPGAGERHFGKKIYKSLLDIRASEIVISDESVSTTSPAKNRTKFNLYMCDAVFSYLVPELREYNKKKKSAEIKDAHEWLCEYYDDVQRMFMSSDFYFRSNFIAGYGIIKCEEEDEW